MIKGTLILLRHGQTTYNEQSRMAGQCDVPLTALGEEQARAAGKLLEGFTIDKVYASSLSRAFNTAALALDGRALSIEKRDEIRECDAGDFTGLKLDDPAVLAFKRGFDTKLPNGESSRELVARVKAFFEAEVLPRLERGETVLLVSHAGVMRALDVAMGLEANIVPAPGPGGDRPDLWASKKTLPNAAPFVAEYADGNLTRFYALDADGKNPPPRPKNTVPKAGP
jgi:2,3-bisphosphoglycerate-dependent phosphoglycerate mutase